MAWPVKRVRRGRPKGCDKTVVGLPKKRHRHKSGPVAFKDLPVDHQRKRLLKWVTGKEATPCDTILTAKDVKLPLPVELLEPVVNEIIIKKHLNRSGWAKLQKGLTLLRADAS